MRKKIITLLVGAAPVGYKTGQEQIDSIWNALKWRLSSAHDRLDASVEGNGYVHLFVRG
jgi:hypothetical protein